MGHGTNHGMVHNTAHVPLHAGTPGQTTLTVVLADSADPVTVTTNFNYTVVVTNTGAFRADTIVALLTIDSDAAYVSSSGTGWGLAHDAGVVTCTRATLLPGAAPTITVTVTAPAVPQTLTSTADADAANSPAATQDSETTVIGL